MNIFDGLAEAAFDVVTTTMGYPATWLPSTGGPPQTAIVLYSDATGPYDLNGMKYDPQDFRFEYRVPYFAGLKELADDGRKREIVTITLRGVIKEFYVRRIDTKYDGKTLIAYLDPKEPETED